MMTTDDDVTSSLRHLLQMTAAACTILAHVLRMASNAVLHTRLHHHHLHSLLQNDDIRADGRHPGAERRCRSRDALRW